MIVFFSSTFAAGERIGVTVVTSKWHVASTISVALPAMPAIRPSRAVRTLSFFSVIVSFIELNNFCSIQVLLFFHLFFLFLSSELHV